MVGTVTNHQTVMFADETSDWMATVQPVTDLTRNVAKNDDASLAEFFSRPIIINATDWNVFDPVFYSYTFDPWTIFLTNKRVANRITNFRLASMKLKVKFMINGNSFYYGRLMADYLPLPTVDNVTIFNTLAKSSLVSASQRLHITIDPTTSQGGILELPFVYPFNTLDLPTLEYTDLGRIYIREINQLRHASGSVIPLNITIAIWAEDVVLAAPTTLPISGLVPQSDEYSVSPVSMIASAVSNAAGALATVPYIGPFARATELISGKMSQIARVFGFARPVIIDKITPMRPYYIGNMANCDAPDSSTKLSVDSKQELTVDTRVCGADLGDELVLHKLASIPSWINTFPWSTTAARDSLLYNVRVTPSVAVFDAGNVHRTAAAFVANPFTYWRGTIRYRFQIVASAFHRGRLRIVYDPSYVNSLESSISFTKIVDLAEERDFVIDVAWANPRTWLSNVDTVNSTGQQSLAAFTSVSGSANGVLGVYVMNKLTSSSDTVANDIGINVYMSMTDDAKFALPRNLDNYVPVYNMTFQSDSYDAVSPADNSVNGTLPITCINNCIEDDQTDLVYMGESIVSFRQLLKRYRYYRTYGSYAVGTTRLFRVQDSDFPAYQGYNPTALSVSAASGKWDYCARSLIHYLVPAFVGMRGGMRVKYVLSGPGAASATSMSVYRWVTSQPRAVSTTANVNNNFSELAWWRSNAASPVFDAGALVTVPDRMPVLEAELPNQVPWRFSYAKNVTNDSSPVYPTSPVHRVDVLANTAGEIILDRYQSVAEDFSLFWFCGAPPVTLAAIPVPVVI